MLTQALSYDRGVEIPFIKPKRAQNESLYINEALNSGSLQGGGEFSKWCSKWLQFNLGVDTAILTNSATDALEMAAILLNIGPGDEVIMPSFTFSSSANAFVLRGATPVFIDVDSNTLNIDASLIEQAITSKTKALVVVHYAGVSGNLEQIISICKKYNIFLVEDAAQAMLAKSYDQYLGTFGQLACLSFHSTKNIISGEGGALLINESSLVERAKVLLEKGTNREKYINGEVDKYSWVDVGSSYLPSEVTAAYLKAQLEDSRSITEYRLENWNYYQNSFLNIAEKYSLGLTSVPSWSEHNAHIFYVTLPDIPLREIFIQQMKQRNIQCTSHYIPLHNSLAGERYGRIGSNMSVTMSLSQQLVRLPMWSERDLPKEDIFTAAEEVLLNMRIRDL